jgi:hypothetical protein
VIAEYFRRFIYSTAQGYEAALAHSNRFAQGDVPVEHPPQPEAHPQPQNDQISRGGDIGEVSG